MHAPPPFSAAGMGVVSVLVLRVRSYAVAYVSCLWFCRSLCGDSPPSEVILSWTAVGRFTPLAYYVACSKWVFCFYVPVCSSSIGSVHSLCLPELTDAAWLDCGPWSASSSLPGSCCGNSGPRHKNAAALPIISVNNHNLCFDLFGRVGSAALSTLLAEPF